MENRHFYDILKPILTPHGKKQIGEIYFDGKEYTDLSDRSKPKISDFVMQNPDNQIVTDKVWHELVFGLESLGINSAEIRSKAAEMASFFGIQNWFYENVKPQSVEADKTNSPI